MCFTTLPFVFFTPAPPAVSPPTPALLLEEEGTNDGWFGLRLLVVLLVAVATAPKLPARVGLLVVVVVGMAAEVLPFVAAALAIPPPAP